MTNSLEKVLDGGTLPAVPSHAPRGGDQIRTQDLILPHVMLLQPMSKLVTQKEMKVGSFVNSLTEQAYESVVEFIPIDYQHFYNVYRFAGAKKEFDFRTSNEADPRLKGKRWKADDNGKREIEPVMRFLSLVNHQPAIIDFSKSSMRGGQKLATFFKLSRMDLFSSAYKLKSVKETNDQGTFYVKDVEPIGPAGKEEYALCEELHRTFGSKAPVVEADGEDVPF